jgi:hypothetical protein
MIRFTAKIPETILKSGVVAPWMASGEAEWRARD